LSDRLYEGLPKFLKPASKRAWDYRFSDKAYGTLRMIMNPDRYPGMQAINPVGILTKKEAPGVKENTNGAIQKTLSLFCIQSLAFRDFGPFNQLCKGIILKSPMIDDNFRAENPNFPYLNFLDVSYDKILRAYYYPAQSESGAKTMSSPELYPDLNKPFNDVKLKAAKNFDARVCALRQRNRNNYIMFLTQGKYAERN